MNKTISLIAVALTFLAVAGSASAAAVSGSITDRTGDGLTKSRDIKKVNASYDSATGTVSFRIRIAGTIRSPKTQVTAGVGTLKKGQCAPPIGVLGANFPGTVAVWQRENNGKAPVEGTGIATVKEAGSVINLRTKQVALQGLKANCAQVIISNPKTNAQFDSTRPFKLKAAGAAQD